MNTRLLAGSLAIIGAILGYILFNIAVIESGSGLVNYGLMNLIAGLITLGIFHKEAFRIPNLKVASIGILGILAILFGLRLTHLSLTDPSSTMEVVYDLVVLGSLPMWRTVEHLMNLQPKTKIRLWDVLLHIMMAILVLLRLYVHWVEGWNVVTFLPAFIAVVGYWAFNVSLRLAAGSNVRATNISMNIGVGYLILILSMLQGGDSLHVNHGTVIGSIAVMMIVLCLGYAYKQWDEEGLKPLVMPAVYDGLLIFAPLVLTIIYKQQFGIVDWFISLGFIAVFSLRSFFYKKERDEGQRVLQTQTT